MRNLTILSATAGALIAMTAAASAQSAVTATSDLNIRSGPGPQYPVVGVIPAAGDAMLDGCLENSRWCIVTRDGAQGWAYSDYLIADYSGTRVVVTERPSEIAVPVVTYDEPVGGGAVAGATTGAIAGALIAGPIGAAAGGVAGAASGAAIESSTIDPTPEVRTYVRSNPVDPVYLDGEVVVGAGVPEEVVIQEIPDNELRYVYVNGQAVLVEPETRRIVYVIRD